MRILLKIRPRGLRGLGQNEGTYATNPLTGEPLPFQTTASGELIAGADTAQGSYDPTQIYLSEELAPAAATTAYLQTGQTATTAYTQPTSLSEQLSNLFYSPNMPIYAIAALIGVAVLMSVTSGRR